MINFIFDYETMSQDPTRCALVNCAYFVFDTDRFTSSDPYTFKELISEVKLDKFSVPDQKRAGYLIDKDSVDFWMKQTPEVRNQCVPSDDDITRQAHVQNLKSYISGKKVSRWWSRGNTFDPVILKTLDDETGIGIFDILRFWNVRDVRTFVDAKFNFSTRSDFPPFEDTKKWNEVFKKHISIHDVSADIMRMQQIIRAEAELELVNE